MQCLPPYMRLSLCLLHCKAQLRACLDQAEPLAVRLAPVLHAATALRAARTLACAQAKQ